MQSNFIDKISVLIGTSTELLNQNSKRIDNDNATYYYNAERGGKSIIVDDDGTYLLTTSSAINFDKLFEEFKKGRRNGNISNPDSDTNLPSKIDVPSLQEVEKLYKEKKYEHLKQLILSFLKKKPFKYEENGALIMNFSNGIDFWIYCIKNKPNKNIKVRDNYYLYLYTYLSYVYSELNEYENAIKTIDECLEFAPMNIALKFEKCHIYRKQNNIEKFILENNKLYDEIYDASHLAHYYSNIGLYYFNKQDLISAYAFYTASTKFANLKTSLQFLNIINKKLGRKSYNMPMDEGLQIIEGKGYKFGPKQENIDLLVSLYNNNSYISKSDILKNNLASKIYYLTQDKRFAPNVKHVINELEFKKHVINVNNFYNLEITFPTYLGNIVEMSTFVYKIGNITIKFYNCPSEKDFITRERIVNKYPVLKDNEYHLAGNKLIIEQILNKNSFEEVVRYVYFNGTMVQFSYNLLEKDYSDIVNQAITSMRISDGSYKIERNPFEKR